MPRATYTLEAELSYNTWTDIAADWQTATPLSIERGITPGEALVGVGRMTFALHNPDGRYTPGHTNATSGFDLGIGIRLKANDGTSTHTLFYGRITEIVPQHDAKRGQCTVVCEDDMAALGRLNLLQFSGHKNCPIE